MGKKIDVTLAFNADTGKAKSQIQELQSLLNKISYSGATASQSSANAKNLREAADAAKDLAYHLNNAYNNKTGKFDLSLFDKSLKSSNQNLTSLSTKLMSAGKTGQDAFIKLAQSISKADQPMFKLSTRMQDFAKTMKNTIKWQLSSSMLHCFIGAIQSAYGYAKNLNASLNDIRIVTGQSADQMAAFAEQANKAAKRLSTTTTDYTKSSLIYFQQGLDAEEVRKRTEVTIKMANVAGTTAQTVSDQMTAVWNNFYDGGKSLEYYSDVMVALGAATASSTDEISEGVNKFAAAAKTVGLSYEYATAALATITAKTRESADVVGNALKTIFSRLQGLTLGETLDDGTNLNKYSKALDAVGISIKTTDGQLKDMDTILDEMGAKWQTLGQDQQMALAQTVAGVRQYAQLIALMNNYDYFKENLNVAYGAEGTLKKQADIYAESWEAAEKRVRASMQGIYQSLINDKFFIGINNALADALSGLDAFIDAAGGLPTVLATIGSIMLSVFANKMPDALKNLQYNFDILFRPDRIEQSYKAIQDEMKNISDGVLQNANGKGIDPNSSLGFQLQASNQLLEVRSRLARVNDSLSESEQRAYEQSINDITSIQNKILSEKQEVEQLEKKIEVEKKQLEIAQEVSAQKLASKIDTTILSSAQGALREKRDSFIDGQEEMKNVYKNAFDAAAIFEKNFVAIKDKITKNYKELYKTMAYDATEGGQTLGKKYKVFNDDTLKNITAMVEQMAITQKKFGDKKGTTKDRNNILSKQLSALKQTIPKSIADVTGLSKAFEGLEKAMAKGSSAGVVKDNIEKIGNLMKNLTIDGKNADQVLREIFGDKYADLELDFGLHSDNLEAIESDMNNLQQIMDNFNPSHTIQGIEAVSTAVASLGSAYSMIQQVLGLFEALGNPDLTGWEKFGAIITSLTTAVPTFITLMKDVGTITEWASQKQAVLDGTYAASQAKMKVLSGLRAIESKQLTGQAAATEYKNLAEREGLNIDLEAIGANKVQNAQDREKIGNIMAETAAEQAKNAVKKEGTFIQKVLNQLENKSKVLLILGAIITVVSAVIAIFKKFHKSTEEVNKAFEEANSAYKEQQTVVSDLESKLKELNNTIDELRNKGPLSLIEQEQLNKAETQKAITEQQLKLEQQLLELRQQNAASAFIEKINNKGNQPDKLETKTVTIGAKQIAVPQSYTSVDQFDEFLANENIIKKYAYNIVGDAIEGATNATKDIIKEIGEIYNLTEDEINNLLTQNENNKYENFYDWFETNATQDEEAYRKYLDYVNKNFLPVQGSSLENELFSGNVYTIDGTSLQLESLENVEKDFGVAVKSNASQQAELLSSYKQYLAEYQSVLETGKLGPEQITQSINFLKQYQDELWGDNKFQMYEDLGINTIFGQSKNYEQVYKALLSTDDVSQIVDKVDDDFKKRLESMGFSVEDYFQTWIDRFAKVKENFSGDSLLFDEIFNSSKWKPQYLKFIEKVLQEGYTSAEGIFNRLDELVAEETQNTNSSLNDLKTTSTKVLDIASKLKNVGDTISDTDYASLSDEYKSYFQLQNDGTAILLTSAKEFYDFVSSQAQENFKNQIIQDKQNIVDLEQQKDNLIDENDINFAAYNLKSTIQGELQGYKELFNKSEDEYYYLQRKQINEGLTEEESTRLEDLQDIATKIGDLESQLENLYSNEDYKKFFDKLAQIEADQNASKEQLQADQLALINSLSDVETFIALRDDKKGNWFSELSDKVKANAYTATLAKQSVAAGFSYDQVEGYSKWLEETKNQTAEEADINALRFFTIQEGADKLRSNLDNFTEIINGGEDKIAQNISTIAPLVQNLLGIEDDLSNPKYYPFFIEQLGNLTKLANGDTSGLDALIDALEKFGITVNSIDIDALGANPYETTQETKTWRSGYDERSKIISGLSTGGTLTKEEYDKLTDNEQTYFLDMYDGTYKLIGVAEDFKKLANDIEVQNIKSGLEQATGISQEELANRASLWGSQIFADADLASGLVDNAASYFGIKQENFQSLEEYVQAVKEAIEASQALQATTAENLNALQKMDLSQSAFVDGLVQLASSYENCQDELEDYVKVQRQYGKTSDQAKKAATNLQRAIRNEEWKKVTKECKEYIDTLDDLVDTDDIEDAFDNIAKSFNNTFDTNITKEFVSKNIDLFKEWAESSGDEANDLAQKIYYLANIESNLSDVELSINTDKVENQLGGVQNMAEWLKGYIESNPITVDAYGRADLSDLLSSMIGAGATAEQLAAALALLGEAEIDTSAWGTGMASSYPGTIEGMLAFINDLIHFHGGFTVNENGQVSASAAALADTFGSHKTYGTGGRATGSSPKSSGGGGGGSSKHAEKKNDSDKERYHTVLNQLEDLNAEYDDISKAKDRAFGKDRIDYMDAEIKKTDELIAKQGEYLDEIKGYLPVDKAVMEAYYKDLINGPEMLFDEKGNISNFDAIQDAMYAKYNQMTERFTEDDTSWEIFEKKYEQLEKYIEQYEETYDLLRDEEQKYQDLINQRIDAQLEKVQYKVEVKLDVSKDEVAVLEYQLDRINDDAFKSLDAIGLLFDKSMNLEKQIEINKQGLNDALGLSLSLAEISEVMAGNLSVLDGKNFTSDQIDAIKEYRDNLLDLNEQLDDVRENIEEKVLDAFDAWNEKLNTGIEILDNYGSMLDHFKNMIDIVGQDTLGLDEDFMSNLGQGAVDNAINKVKATKDAMESVMKAQEQAQKSLDEARANGDQKSQEMWEDTLKQLDEEARSAQDTFLQAWEDALSGLADQFEQTVDRVVKNFSKSVYQVGGLEGLANDFSQQKDDSDMMLDDYQKIYELSKLSRDINKTIDDTDVISGKQKLKKLLEQVNDLQADGVEMSQYDLEYLQKTYDLRLAELELEEAQRAKNTVRLQKDNEGNWSYIYTQSSDAIDSAQQKYEDALYAMQDLSSNYIDEMSEKLINTSQEMADALAALRVEDFASLDDYYKEVERVQNLYQDRMAAQEEELNKAIANNKELYDTDWTNYHNATGYKISDTENFATAFKDTLLGALMDSDTDSSNFTDLLGQSVQDLTAGLLGAAETYYKNLEEAMNAAGTSTSGFGEDVNEAIDQITAKSDEGAQAVEDMAERMNTAMNDVMSTVEEWQQIYGQAMEEIIQSNLEVIESFNEMIKALGADASNIKINYDITRGSSGAERFATGGYTGEWGSSGKLGILDEKELILNQSDTANMLSAIQLTREIINAIDIGANYASLGFGNLVASSLRDSSRETLEQNVHITAEFPNVNDHNEIELALKNLTNTASQYANRK